MKSGFFHVCVILLVSLTFSGPQSLWADGAETIAQTADEIEAVGEAELSESKKRKKEKDPNRGRFLPIPVIITEPAIGQGLGVALTYFHRSKDGFENDKVATPGTIGSASQEQKAPPTVTGVFGAYTTSKTAAAGVGHMDSFKDDHIRFTGLYAWADVHSKFYIADQALKFNLEGRMLYAETRFRIRNSKWFAGFGVSYLDADSAFEIDLPDDTPLEIFPTELRNVGLSAKLAWDTRDNTSMPNRGQLIDLAVWRYDETIGGDYNYWNGKIKLLSFHPFGEKFVLGLRAEYSAIDGDAPFFAYPYVSLRGIAALRYQGDQVAVAEVEGRYYFSPKWAMNAFIGTGTANSDFSIIESDQSIYSYGLGGRYQIFEAQNIWVGVDVARGPEDTNWYIQVGQTW